MGHRLGYARVSTLDQHPDLQLDALTAAGCYRVYVDTASGALDARPELTKVLDQLRPGDTLVVWKLNRLGRSLRHLIDTVGALEGRGVGFTSLQEHLDTTTPGGKLVFHLFGALAEFERDLIRERTTAGLSSRRWSVLVESASDASLSLLPRASVQARRPRSLRTSALLLPLLSA